ncbi:MAG: FAD-dependent oxidoreductase, partial [Clostridia bacterium]|nr:FAD-dependent oxidoreductase [Clostridia bacterium]
SFLRDFFKTNKVPVYLETKTTEIRDNGVTIATKDGKTLDVPADNVILSVGYKPAPLAEKAKHVHVIGDAAKVGNLRTVIWGAWDVAMKL